jgi:hypothetical protein
VDWGAKGKSAEQFSVVVMDPEHKIRSMFSIMSDPTNYD